MHSPYQPAEELLPVRAARRMSFSTGCHAHVLRRLAQAALALCVSGAAFAQSERAAPLVITRSALAVKFQIAVVDAEADAFADVLAALDEVDALEAQINVWSPTSAISAWNAGNHDEPVDVPLSVASLVAATQRMSARTDGAFDITVGPLFDVWGLTDRRLREPSPEELAEARACVGSALLTVTIAPPRLGRARPCVRVDLSAAAKGYAVAHVVARLRAAGITNAFVAAGSSTVCAIGRGPDGEGWPFEVEPGRTWLLVDQAVATSGFSETDVPLADGRIRRHILDPRTATPAARDVARAIFVGPDPLEADMASTALVVLGEQGGAEWAAREGWRTSARGAVLVLSDGRSVTLGATPD